MVPLLILVLDGQSATDWHSRLCWFQAEVTKRKLLESFKKPASLLAVGRFVAINITLLRNLKFQEINQKAIGKILKSESATSKSSTTFEHINRGSIQVVRLF